MLRPQCQWQLQVCNRAGQLPSLYRRVGQLLSLYHRAGQLLSHYHRAGQLPNLFPLEISPPRPPCPPETQVGL